MPQVCRFYQSGNCKFGDQCRFEHPGASRGGNRFSSFGGKSNALSGSSPPYNLSKETIEKDLTSEAPTWILSCYGPGRDAPEQLFGGYPREQSTDEIRLHYEKGVAAGKQAEVLQEINGLYDTAKQQMQTAVSNLDNAIQFIADAADKRPNRLQIIEASNPPGRTPGEFAVGKRPAGGGTAAPNAFGGGASGGGLGAASGGAFGQPSSMGAKPNPFGADAGTGSSGFGQPSGGGAFAKPAAPAFGSTSGPGSAFGAGATTTSAFGQPSGGGGGAFGQPSGGGAFGQPSAMGQRPSAFGAPSGQAPAGGAFGQPSQMGGASGFGQPSALGAKPSPFGAPSGAGSGFSAFANAGKTGGAFGQPSQPATSGAFGQPSQPATSSPFGAPSQPETSSPFGAPSQPATSGAFGASSQPATSGAFGASSQPATSGAFGAPSQPATSGPFGSGTGQPVANNPFGAPQGGSSAPNPFAKQDAAMDSGMDAQPTGFAAQQGSAFGQPSQAANPFDQPKPALAAPGDANNPYPPDSNKKHPPLESYATASMGQLSAWKGRPVSYKEGVPGYMSSGGKWTKIWFPSGPPAYYGETEEKGPRAMEEAKVWGGFSGRFDVMPEVPPMRVHCTWDF